MSKTEKESPRMLQELQELRQDLEKIRDDLRKGDSFPIIYCLECQEYLEQTFEHDRDHHLLSYVRHRSSGIRSALTIIDYLEEALQ